MLPTLVFPATFTPPVLELVGFGTGAFIVVAALFRVVATGAVARDATDFFTEPAPRPDVDFVTGVGLTVETDEAVVRTEAEVKGLEVEADVAGLEMVRVGRVVVVDCAVVGRVVVVRGHVEGVTIDLEVGLVARVPAVEAGRAVGFAVGALVDAEIAGRRVDADVAGLEVTREVVEMDAGARETVDVGGLHVVEGVTIDLEVVVVVRVPAGRAVGFAVGALVDAEVAGRHVDADVAGLEVTREVVETRAEVARGVDVVVVVDFAAVRLEMP